MNADWSQLLASPEHLGELYDGRLPSPQTCDLFYVHIDEREKSVTLGFDTREFPVNPPEQWVLKRFNAFEFYLVFTGVEDLWVTGWGASVAKLATVGHLGAQVFEVILGSRESGIGFRGSAARMAKTRAYLASGSP
ncbi:Imm50 family immunity protein [Streptomyces sp. NPDC096152]|uniref:Imm50 family immunity protein n=1 Tax=Streptomyces sp. NPDC096152 TaxID=3366078 RepID=UPI003823D58D